MREKYSLHLAALLLSALLGYGSFAQQNTLPPSLFTDNRETLENEKLAAPRSQLEKALSENGFPIPDIKKGRVRKLMCYENAFIYEFEGSLNNVNRLYTAIASNDFYRMFKGESAVIYAMNERQRPILNTETGVKEYVRLFVGALTADKQQRFRIFDSHAEITRFLTPVAEIFSTDIKPSRVVSLGSAGNPAKVSVNMKYQTAFFRAEMDVTDSGAINILSDKSIFAFPNYFEKFDKGCWITSQEVIIGRGIFFSAITHHLQRLTYDAIYTT